MNGKIDLKQSKTISINKSLSDLKNVEINAKCCKINEKFENIYFAVKFVALQFESHTLFAFAISA